ncbi:MAG: 16S rRNA (guanine(527)-N(7))-methyltransferase RsmG [Firmicutes bacterium]|jgi:16S rRNA (guanine527-N7)-methyltransferase|nr:16S rRNA (guanine(527)-N(7))-methyltransferase RsmG [Bacillota bacterium]
MTRKVERETWDKKELRERLRAGARSLGVELSAAQVGMFLRYGQELAAWNERVNLSAIKNPADVITKHFLDSLAVVPYLPFEAENIVDVGSGAGLPGLALKVARPELDVLLVESIGKKVEFLRHVTAVLNLVGVEVVKVRAEELGQNPSYRERYQVGVARAVAMLPVLAELVLPLVKLGGLFIAFKGPDVREELEAAQRAFTLLGGEVEAVHEWKLPGGAGQRSIILVRKVSATPPQYPRAPGRPGKRPL